MRFLKSQRFKNIALITAAFAWPLLLALATGYPYHIQNSVHCEPNGPFDKFLVFLGIIFISMPSLYCIWKASFKVDRKIAILTGFILLDLPISFLLMLFMVIEYGAECY